MGNTILMEGNVYKTNEYLILLSMIRHLAVQNREQRLDIVLVKVLVR